MDITARIACVVRRSTNLAAPGFQPQNARESFPGVFSSACSKTSVDVRMEKKGQGESQGEGRGSRTASGEEKPRAASENSVPW